MKAKTYSVFKDAMFPAQKILSVPFNVALADLWPGHINTCEALSDLEAHSVIWDFSEIKKIYSVINFHVLYQEKFSCEINYRDGFESSLEDARWTHEYHNLDRKQLLFLLLIFCDSCLLDDFPSEKVTVQGNSTVIKTDDYELRMENSTNGMPGSRFEYKVPGQFEMNIFAYKSA